LSPKQLKQITIVDIGGYEQPIGVLVCVTLSFTFKFSNNFYCRSGYKDYFMFKIIAVTVIMARLKGSESYVTKVR